VPGVPIKKVMKVVEIDTEEDECNEETHQGEKYRERLV